MLDAAVYSIPHVIASAKPQAASMKRAFGPDPAVYDEASPAYHVQIGKGLPAWMMLSQGPGATLYEQANIMADSMVANGHGFTYVPFDLNHAEINAYLGVYHEYQVDELGSRIGTPSPDAFEKARALTDTVAAFFLEHLTVPVDGLPPSGSASAPGPDVWLSRAGRLLRYRVPRTGMVTVSVFRADGRRVAVAARGVVRAGPHAVRLDLSSLAGGRYLVVLDSPFGRRLAPVAVTGSYR
jgi:hypothetical protein